MRAVISRWPLRAKVGQKGQGLAGSEPGRREEDPQKDPPRPLGEKSRRGGRAMRDLQKSSKFGMERRITLGYLGAGTVSSTNHPAASSTNPGRAFFSVHPRSRTQGFEEKAALTDRNSCIQTRTGTFSALRTLP
jgi:hypothetical protein